MYNHTYHWYLNKKNIQSELPSQDYNIKRDKTMINNGYTNEINNTDVLTD